MRKNKKKTTKGHFFILSLIFCLLGSLALRAQDDVKDRHSEQSEESQTITDDQVLSEMTDYLHALNTVEVSEDTFHMQLTFLQKLKGLWKLPEFRKLKSMSLHDILLNQKENPYFLIAISFHTESIENINSETLTLIDPDDDRYSKIVQFRDELRNYGSMGSTNHITSNIFHELIKKNWPEWKPLGESTNWDVLKFHQKGLSPNGNILAMVDQSEIKILDRIHPLGAFDPAAYDPTADDPAPSVRQSRESDPYFSPYIGFSAACEAPYHFHFSPDHTKLAYVCRSEIGYGGQVNIYDLISGKHLDSIGPSDAHITGMEFNPQSDRLAIRFGLADRIQIWDLDTRQVVTSIIDHGPLLSEYSFDFNNKLDFAYVNIDGIHGNISATNEAGTTWSYDLIPYLRHHQMIKFSPNEQYLAFANDIDSIEESFHIDSIKKPDLENKSKYKKNKIDIDELMRQLKIKNSDIGTFIQKLEKNTNEIKEYIRNFDKELKQNIENFLKRTNIDQTSKNFITIKLYDLKKDEFTHEFQIPKRYFFGKDDSRLTVLTHITFNAQSNLLASSDSSGHVYLWDIKTQKMILSDTATTHEIQQLLFTDSWIPGQHHLLAFNQNALVDLWQLGPLTQEPDLSIISLIDPDKVNPHRTSEEGGEKK